MIAVAALAAAAAVWVEMSSFALARARLGRIPAIGEAAPDRIAASVVNAVRSPLAAAAVVGCSTALLVGGVAGLVLGAFAALVLARWLRRLEPLAARRRRERVASDLPVAAEILAACVVAGASVQDALSVTADAVGGPLGGYLRHVEHRLRLGTDPRMAWRAETGVEIATLAVTITRSLDSGAPLADALLRVADQLRAEHTALVRERVRAVGVRAAAPLGLCFLPAFVLVGVVPVVVSFAQTLVPVSP
ncbi:MAG: type II secretion system F family protein [Candidatus Nanopelagicales bacterium]